MENYVRDERKEKKKKAEKGKGGSQRIEIGKWEKRGIGVARRVLVLEKMEIELLHKR